MSEQTVIDKNRINITIICSYLSVTHCIAWDQEFLVEKGRVMGLTEKMGGKAASEGEKQNATNMSCLKVLKARLHDRKK